MRVVSAILLVFLSLGSSVLHAQEDMHESAESIVIDDPAPGTEVRRPFLVRGTAPSGAVLDLMLDGEFHGVFRANQAGEFAIPIDAEPELVEVRMHDGDAGMSVAVVVAGEREPATSGRDSAGGDAADAGEVTAEDTEDLFNHVEEAPDEPPIEAEKELPRGPDWEPWDPGTMIAQALIGTLVGGGLGAAVFLFGAGTEFIVFYGVLGASVGFVTLGLTVQALGRLFGGRSLWWATFSGALVGILAAAFFPPALLILPGVGATVGYHLAAKSRSAESPE